MGICPFTLPPHPPPLNGSMWVMFSACNQVFPSGATGLSEVRSVPVVPKSVLIDVSVMELIMLLSAADSGPGCVNSRGGEGIGKWPSMGCFFAIRVLKWVL